MSITTSKIKTSNNGLRKHQFNCVYLTGLRKCNCADLPYSAKWYGLHDIYGLPHGHGKLMREWVSLLPFTPDWLVE